MVGTIEELPDSEGEREMGRKLDGTGAPPRKQYRGMFEGGFIDFLVYVVAVVAGVGCLYLGLNSPTVSVYRMMRMKMPQTDLFHEKMVRFVAWWAFSISLVLFGGISVLISCIGFLTAVVCKANDVFRATGEYLASSSKEKTA